MRLRRMANLCNYWSMLLSTETSLRKIDDADPGSLVLRFISGGRSAYGIVVVTSTKTRAGAVIAGGNGLYDLELMAMRNVGEHSTEPILQLGRAVVRYDPLSHLPIDDFFPNAAFIISPERSGFYEKSRHFEDRGYVATLEGVYAEHSQSVREVGFRKYEVGIMRDDVFVPMKQIDLTL